MYTHNELENLLQDGNNLVTLEDDEISAHKIRFFKANGFKVFANVNVNYTRQPRTWLEWFGYYTIQNWKASPAELATDTWIPPQKGIFRYEISNEAAEYIIYNSHGLVRLRLDRSERVFTELIGCALIREWTGEYSVLKEAEQIAIKRGFLKIAVFTNNKEILETFDYKETGCFMIKEFILHEHYVARF